MTAADFAAYHITQSAPLSCTYRGYIFLSAPPPSSGGTTLCEILHVLEGYDLRAMGFYSAHMVRVMVEAMRHAYFDRNTYLGDPEFAINYSVLDHAGNAVAVTYTLNGYFGAGVMAGDTGFLLNNEMDDFSAKPGVANQFGLVQGEANAIAPGKRPLSSMAPTIVMHDGHVFLILGSPGGPRIITAILETALNILDFGMSPQEAVNRPRLHHQWQRMRFLWNAQHCLSTHRRSSVIWAIASENKAHGERPN